MFKILKKLIIFFFLISTYLTNAYSSDSVRFINLDLIIQNTISGKSLLASIELDRDKNLNDFKKKETELRNKEKQIINQKIFYLKMILILN